ncbi:hypothetical protein TRAPUB_9093 [Trametes pubescens]|uniref:Uncharacterized protein n=1 Tax=Trametes pubescens TaxID=154538 RepID=A0A1M2W3J7_TRAPU|nr:hypothetical protein TRAPUB_9093 [Trametes pubescens]
MSQAYNGSSAEPYYQWDSEVYLPSRTDLVPRYRDVFPNEPEVPYVPLNADHRYLTPPPLDPRYMDEDIGPKNDAPPIDEADWAPLPDSDEDEPAGARLTLAPPGLAPKPMVVHEDESDGWYRTTSALDPPPVLDNSPRRSTRKKASTSRAQSSPYKRPQPSTSNTASASKSPSSRTKGRNARAGPSAAARPPAGQATRGKKNAANKYAPKTSSPLKNSTTQESKDVRAGPATQGRWYIPPRKHSTGSVSVGSDSSDDSSASDSE